MCWRYEYIFLILLSTGVDYISALNISKSEKPLVRRGWLTISLAINLGLLAFFKYYYFFTDSVESFLGFYNVLYHFPDLKILLSVGISFYTFQTLSYTIDVYRGDTPPERNLLNFALYVSFFPQLVAGPIERSYQLLPQFREKFAFDYERVRDGILLMTWGFFKKLVIADRLAEYVDYVYNNPLHYGGVCNWIATYFFGFQIYCDFSGYSDIAIGVSLILGFKLMDNFRQPYFSSSVQEFWGRWHISLSTWFRDYVYIPLGGNRVSLFRWCLNLLIVFLVSGLWHGAQWTIVIWGGLHGIYLIAEILIKYLTSKMGIKLQVKDAFTGVVKFLKWVVTFNLVMLGWIFFRSNSVHDARVIISRLFDFGSHSYQINLFQNPLDFYISIFAITVLVFVEWMQWKEGALKKVFSSVRLVRWSIYLIMVWAIFVFCKFNGANFLYFQF